MDNKHGRSTIAKKNQLTLESALDSSSSSDDGTIGSFARQP